MSRTLVIDRWHPTTINTLLNCGQYSRARLKQIDRDMVIGYVILNQLPRATGKRRVNLTIVRGDSDPGREADPDAYWKSLLDALVWAKQLIDDREEWCEHRFVGTQRGPVKQTIVELIDL